MQPLEMPVLNNYIDIQILSFMALGQFGCRSDVIQIQI
jgi:hypothetical protein